MLAGIRLDYKGEISYFGTYTDKDREENPAVKNSIGYTGPGNYYLPQWTVRQIEELTGLLFDGFDKNRFRQVCEELAIFNGKDFEPKKKVSALSDGTRMKLMIAGVLARPTNLLLLDEPASPLDPLMRDKLCEIIRDYLSEDEGNRSVFFSTHNISDMENVTDYAIIMEHGNIAEQGFVEDLKEKYILVKGEKQDIDAARPHMYTMSENAYGFEGICLAENLDRLSGMDIATEIPSLFQISVAVMKTNSKMRIK
jgi:ABC-2 type transport system ATP-binding protein